MKDLKQVSTLPPKDADKSEDKKKISKLVKELSALQAKLYAQKKYAVLIVLQGLDAAGKDDAVKNVFTGVNPTGCRVKSFKAPTAEEAAHDFLWRIHKECPEKGMIQIFNRSYYEDVLVPSVDKLLDADTIAMRYFLINDFEKLLTLNGTIILKFYLHVSYKEEMQRINKRRKDPEKRWKYQAKDIVEVNHHDDYLQVFGQILERCSEHAPWYLVPSDKKWYKNYQIIHTIVNELKKYDIDYPDELPEG